MSSRPRVMLCAAHCHPDAWSGDDDALYLVARAARHVERIAGGRYAIPISEILR